MARSIIDNKTQLRLAVIIPCYNEESAIGHTIAGFRASLPSAVIYVYDNNSSDNTAEVARRSGAIVRFERMQGKGHVVRRMFADVDADIYIMVDGDATYDSAAAPAMVARMIDEQLDMLVGSRESDEKAAYRKGHKLGNAMLTGLLKSFFGHSFTDILSGYRVFSRRFVKSFPVLSSGFEIETEISVHALEMRMPVGEMKTRYGSRSEGSVSKLSTYRDGWRILRMMIQLLRFEKPVAFFGSTGVFLLILAFFLSIPLIFTYIETGLVPRLPTAVIIIGLMIMASLSIFCGLILDTVVRGRQEIRRIAYLSYPAITGSII